MPKTHPTVKEKILTFQKIECRLTFPTGVRGHANALYLKLPTSCADYYDIRAGDTVLISILEVRRAKQEE